MGSLLAATPPGTAAAEIPPGKQPADVAPLPIIWSLLGRQIAFHRRLVDLTNGVKSALLLSQSIYWTRRGRDIAQRGGWFHKSVEQWAWETGLSLREQTGARDALKELALVEECRMGVPARLYFRLDMEQLGNRLTARFDADPRIADWSDTAMVARMLGPSVAYHRTLAGVSGGVHAGLLLSRALYLTRIRGARALDGWISNSSARWSLDIGLTRREQENARRDLARIGVWEEALRGIPPRLVARIQLEYLLSLLTQGAPATADDASRTAASACGESTSSFAQNVETSMLQPHMLVSTKPPSQIRQNSHPSIYTKSTSELVQPQHRARVPDAPGAVADSPDGGGGDLIFPEEMLPQECAAARLLLRGSGDQAQALLDELAGRLQAHGVRGSPVAYLRGLIARADAGTFLPELGSRVASERRQRQLAAEQRRVREAAERSQEIERATPEYQARVRAQREKLNQLRDDLKQRLGTGRSP